MMKSVYEAIIADNKLSNEENELLVELCNKHSNKTSLRSRILKDMIDDLNNYQENQLTINLKQMISSYLQSYQQKSYYHYMDYIEVGVNKFINDFYAKKPSDDIYLCIYLLFIQNKNIIESRLNNDDLIDTAYNLVFNCIIADDTGRIEFKEDELSGEDLEIFKYFQKNNSLYFNEMSFFQPQIIIRNYFCMEFKEMIEAQLRYDADNWIREFTLDE